LRIERVEGVRDAIEGVREAAQQALRDRHLPVGRIGASH
jgi:hypothetical protein